MTKFQVIFCLLVCFTSPSFQVQNADPVDPSTFVCNKWSPMTDPVWSTGTPSVALTHIFCGQIQDQGKTAEGFHSRPNNKDPTCAKASGYQATIKGIRCYDKEEVYDAKNIKWVERPTAKRYCFFPESWSIADTVTRIQAVYGYCKDKISNNQICGRNYKNEGFDMIIFLRNNNQVVSSFATPSQDVYCKVNCDLTNLRSDEFNRAREFWPWEILAKLMSEELQN